MSNLAVMMAVLALGVTKAQAQQVTQEELNAAEAGLLKLVWPGSIPPLPTSTHDATGTNVDRSATQWLKLATDANGNFASIANGRVYDASPVDPRYYYFPSLMVNRKGDMVMGFSGSRSNEFIGTFYSYRSASGTTPGSPLVLHPGQGPFLNNSRWGDYSCTSLDPLDSLSFWTVQQYADDEQSPSGNRWGTWISEVVPNVSNP